jgi:hypothetical protein
VHESMARLGNEDVDKAEGLHARRALKVGVASKSRGDTGSQKHSTAAHGVYLRLAWELTVYFVQIRGAGQIGGEQGGR